jgi:hypothetical protein
MSRGVRIVGLLAPLLLLCLVGGSFAAQRMVVCEYFTSTT